MPFLAAVLHKNYSRLSPRSFHFFPLHWVALHPEYTSQCGDSGRTIGMYAINISKNSYQLISLLQNKSCSFTNEYSLYNEGRYPVNKYSWLQL